MVQYELTGGGLPLAITAFWEFIVPHASLIGDAVSKVTQKAPGATGGCVEILHFCNRIPPNVAAQVGRWVILSQRDPNHRGAALLINENP